MAEVRRSAPAELRSASFRAKKHLAPANASGLEDVLGQGSDVPSDGTSLLLTNAQFSGPGTQADGVAMESAGRIRLSRAPHVKYKCLLPNGVQSMDKAPEFFRRVAKYFDGSLVRAVACEREFIGEAMRVLYTPSAPSGKGLSPPAIRPGGLSDTVGVLRTLSRVVRDAARVETPLLRVFAACYSYLLKYNMPVSKGEIAPSRTPKSPRPKQPAPS